MGDNLDKKNDTGQYKLADQPQVPSSKTFRDIPAHKILFSCFSKGHNSKMEANSE